MENKGHILNTRVKLRIDTNRRWESSSSTPLLEGEIGIGYDVVWNKSLKSYEKCNFRIKIGRTLLDSNGKPTRHSTRWNESADLTIVLSNEQKSQIIESLLPQIKNEFVTIESYNKVVDLINSRLTVMEARLQDRTTAWVDKTTLYLSEGDKFNIKQ